METDHQDMLQRVKASPYLLGKPIEWKPWVAIALGVSTLESLLVRETN